MLRIRPCGQAQVARRGHRHRQPERGDDQGRLQRIPTSGAEPLPHQPLTQIPGHHGQANDAQPRAARRVGRRATTAVSAAWVTSVDTGADRAVP
jgi:hypothetical protein